MTASKNRITPSDFSPVVEKSEAAAANKLQQKPNQKPEKSYNAILLIAGLAVLALFLVLFPLGQNDENAPVANESALPPATTEGTVLSATNESSINENQISEQPWADSQLLKARREAQEVLARLLPLQNKLEQMRASEWDQQALNEMTAAANLGDETYQAREFDTAITHYNRATSLAERLLTEASTLAPNYLRDGTAALAQNQTEIALHQLELATLLNPDLDAAKAMLERAKVREEILDLESIAVKQQQAGSLEAARETWLAIQVIDKDYEKLDVSIQQIDEQILDKSYRAAMSQGFSALSRRELSIAEQAFLQAGKLKPKSTAVKEALQQVEASRINNQRQVAIDNATALEASEKWAEAMEIYENLLVEDATLTSATLGKIRTSARADLNSSILNVLAEPLKLQNENAWKSANSLLAEAKNIIDRGPVLRNQIEELDFIVKRARTEVTLKLSSDSLTNVEIYRVGKLGQFREQAVSLYPGRYVVIGTRSGYRDVREDLILDGDTANITLTIQCDELI